MLAACTSLAVAGHLRPAALLLVHRTSRTGPSGSSQLVSVDPVALAGIVVGEICRTVTLVSSPYHWPFEILWIVYWLSILVIIMSFTGLLVLLPNWDTIKARQVCTLICCAVSVLLKVAEWFACLSEIMPFRNAVHGTFCCTGACATPGLHGLFFSVMQAHHKHSRSDDQEMGSVETGSGKLGHFENPGSLKMNGIKV